MRESVVVQVGQCGNQVGNQFWKNLLVEHERTPDDDPSLSTFFRFAPAKRGQVLEMKARALLIDMECGPLQETMKSSLGSLFDETQFVMDVYGSGNNFAHGFAEYGPKYRAQFEEALSRIAEKCESLQSFILTHSLGGGTGSGVGSYVLGLLEDHYPAVTRFTTSVFPAEEDDVVTSPYNSILAAAQLIEHADCSFPLDNLALQSFAHIEDEAKSRRRKDQYEMNHDSSRKIGRGFDSMNNSAALMLCHLTASARLPGQLNVDLNEISTNLVPFPRIPFLLTALSPQRSLSTHSRSKPSESSRLVMNRAMSDVLGSAGQLSAAVPSAPGGLTLASALLSRGSIQLSDMISSVSQVKKSLRFPSWNEDACKVGDTQYHQSSCRNAYN